MKKEHPVREFFIKHGWAVLVVLVTFTAVFYLQNNAATCTLAEGIDCVDVRVLPTGLSIVVHNGLAEDITIQQVRSGQCRIGRALPLNRDESATINLEGCSFGSPGNRISAPIEISYATHRGELVQEKGSVAAFIELSK